MTDEILHPAKKRKPSVFIAIEMFYKKKRKLGDINQLKMVRVKRGIKIQ